jgi:hypothetical protein
VLAKSESSTVPSGCFSFCWDGVQFFPIGAQMLKYISIHRQIFGRYAYGLPPRPRDFAQIDMTAMAFLEKHGLTSLIGLLRYLQQAQGYGVLETVPAFYMLWWTNADLFEAIINETVRREQGQITMLSTGYEPLWASMAARHTAKHMLKVLTEARVTAVARGDGTTKVAYSTPSGDKEDYYDKVIFAANLTEILPVVTDLTAEERTIFGELTTVTLATTLYEADPVTHEHPVELWFSRMQPSEAEGRLYAHRNSRLALDTRSAPPPGGRERRVAYQHINRPTAPGDDTKLAEQLRADLSISGETGITIMEQRVWNCKHAPSSLRAVCARATRSL